MALALLGALVWAAPAAAQPAAATLRLTPTVGPPNTKAVVAGRAFGSSETVDLAFDSAPWGSAITDPNGAFSQPERIPASASPGDHTISATGESSGRSAQATFTVRTDWPKAHFDPANTGHNPYENVLSPQNVGNLALRWSVPTPSSVVGSISVVGGVVYAGLRNLPGFGDAYVIAVDAATGTVLWRYDDPNELVPELDVDYGRVYVSMLTCHCLRALDAKTGTLLWTFSGPTGTPAVAHGVVYVGSDIGYLYAIDARTGQQIWRTAGPDPFDAPAVVGSRLYVGGDFHYYLYAVDRSTGAILWTFPTANSIVGSPSYSHGLVYAGSSDDHVYAVDAVSGNSVWTQATGNSVPASPAVGGGVVYIGSWDHVMYALDAKTGSVLWNVPTEGLISVSAAVANGVVFDGSSSIDAFDATTGAALWSYPDLFGSGPSVADGVLYVGSQDQLYAFSLP